MYRKSNTPSHGRGGSLVLIGVRGHGAVRKPDQQDDSEKEADQIDFGRPSFVRQIFHWGSAGGVSRWFTAYAGNQMQQKSCRHTPAIECSVECERAPRGVEYPN